MGMHILIVEDEENARMGMKLILEDAGHTTCWAANGEAALQQAAIEKPDLVLLDVKLGPGIDGIEVARRLPKHVNVIIVSALSTYEIYGRAVSVQNAINGVLAIVEKPVDGNELLKLIKAVSHSTNPSRV